MALYLGNLSVKQLESRCQITLTDEERNTLESIREHNCNKVNGDNKIHIYDLPFIVVCGNPQARKTVIDILTPYANKIKVPLQIGGGV